jgi:hypothetical protein
MCPSKPKTPKVQDIPIRAAALMPDNGDPSVRLGLRTRRSLTAAAAVLANRGGPIGLPSVSGPASSQGV